MVSELFGIIISFAIFGEYLATPFMALDYCVFIMSAIIGIEFGRRWRMMREKNGFRILEGISKSWRK